MDDLAKLNILVGIKSTTEHVKRCSLNITAADTNESAAKILCAIYKEQVPKAKRAVHLGLLAKRPAVYIVELNHRQTVSANETLLVLSCSSTL